MYFKRFLLVRLCICVCVCLGGGHAGHPNFLWAVMDWKVKHEFSHYHKWARMEEMKQFNKTHFLYLLCIFFGVKIIFSFKNHKKLTCKFFSSIIFPSVVGINFYNIFGGYFVCMSQRFIHDLWTKKPLKCNSKVKKLCIDNKHIVFGILRN